MAFKPGHRKIGGRKKGTLNKVTSDIFEMCNRKGVNPLEVLMELCCHMDDQLRLRAASELAQYLFPKRKAIEHEGKIDHELSAKIEALQQLPDDELKKIVNES